MNGRTKRAIRSFVLLVCIAALGFAFRPQAATTQAGFLPELEPLTVANAGQTLPLARLGRGVARAVVWSPDGQTLAVVSSIGVWLHEANDTQGSAHLLEGQLGASSAAFSPDGQTIATGGDDGSVALWNAAEFTEQRWLAGHIYRVTAATFSPDGRRLATADLSGVTRVWDVATGSVQAVFNGPGDPQALAFSADGAMLAVASPTSVQRWSPDGQPLAEWTLPPEQADPVALAFDVDGTLYAAGAGTVFRLETDQQPDPVLNAPGLRALDIQEGSSIVAVYVQDGEIGEWSSATGEVQTLAPTGGAMFDRLVLGAGGALAAIERLGGSVHVWSPDANLTVLRGYSPALTRIAAGDGLVTAVSESGTATLWNVDTGERVRQYAAWTGTGSGDPATLSPDGDILATGGMDSVIRLRDAGTGVELRALHGHLRGVTAVAFSRDGSLLASGSLDTTVLLWNVETGQMLARLPGHTLGVTGLAFSGGNRWLASVSFDGTTRLWGVAVS